MNGRRVVRLAGACEISKGMAERIDTQFVFVRDGGECYFGAFFDMESKRLVGFGFNGVA